MVRFRRCFVWFVPALLCLSSTVTLASRNPVSGKYARHDKNWWFWNQEAKEKLGTRDDTQEKVEKEINELEFERSVNQFKPNVDSLRSLFPKEPLTYRKAKKRWLSGTFGLCGRKKLYKGSQKWIIDNRRSGSNGEPPTPLYQEQWMVPKKRLQVFEGSQNHNYVRNNSGWPRFDPRVYGAHPEETAIRQNSTNQHADINVENPLFRGSHHDYNRGNDVESFSYRPQQEVSRLPEQSPKSNEYLRPQPAAPVYQQWTKSSDPLWDRYVTPLEELKYNPFTQPYPQDPRLSISWHTPPHLGTSEPLRVTGNRAEIMERRGVGKFKNKKAHEKTENLPTDYELIPKVYALNKIRSGKKKGKNYSDRLEDPVANPIIVPGFKRQHHDNSEESPQRPYVVHTEDRQTSFDDDFVQVSRANKNQTKTLNDSTKVASGGVPMQLPAPYAFPGGVNISILVPNLPAQSSHDSFMSPAGTTEKNAKKKKERKKKVKNDDELREDLLCEPRSLVSTSVNRKFPHDDKTSVSPLLGGGQINGMKLMNYIFPNNAIDSMKYPSFDWTHQNFSLLGHMKNLTLNQSDLDKTMFGVLNDVRTPFDDRDDEDDDESRMLYDDEASSYTTRRSDEELPYGPTVSFSWYRLTDRPHRTSGWTDLAMNGKTSSERMTGFEFGGSGTVKPAREGSVDIKYNPNKKLGTVEVMNGGPFRRQGEKPDAYGEANPSRSCVSRLSESRSPNYGHPSDQWDALDEDIKSGETAKGFALRAKNRKRDTDDYDHEKDDEQGYYRLSVGGEWVRSPSGFIKSAIKAKSNKHREYYDEIPPERIEGGMRPKGAASPSSPFVPSVALY